MTIIKISYGINTDGVIFSAHKNVIQSTSDSFFDAVKADLLHELSDPTISSEEITTENIEHIEETTFESEDLTIAVYDGAEDIQIHYARVD